MELRELDCKDEKWMQIAQDRIQLGAFDKPLSSGITENFLRSAE
jgi:hypothetical protein